MTRRELLIVLAVYGMGGITHLNRWQYTEDMPQLPVLNVGLVPLLQMFVLIVTFLRHVNRYVPPLIFRIAANNR